MTRSSINMIGAMALAVVVGMASSSPAALVSGGYAGTISQDDGLGLVGQTMKVEFTYDDATAVAYTILGTTYENLLTSATVTIGSNVWTWNNAGGSYATLYDNDIILVYVGEEDRLEMSAYDFSGPDLVGGVSDSSYALNIYLNDDMPDGVPDGLSSEALPPSVPDPALFQYTQFERPIIDFNFIAGDLELGQFYQIEANNIRMIPEPATMGMMGVGGVLMMMRRRGRGA